MNIPKIKRLAYGGDYNPEQWPEAVWAEDARLMREAGVNFVSVGIFAWARLNPAPGVYTFGWLDRVMDLLAAHGVHVCLATATAAPPHWLVRAHPEILPVNYQGLVYHGGSRRHYTPNSPVFREHAAALTRALAERYRGHPALAAWHVDNELTCHFSESYTEADAAAFRRWLRRRYVTLDELNDSWTTSFWGQVYFAWDEVEPPRRTPAQNNPSAVLDWKRFTSDSYLEFYRLLAEILREVTPGVPVTTNTMGMHLDYDGFAWAPHLDFAALDSYPDPGVNAHLHEPEIAGALAQDVTRAMKAGAPWVLMEQAPNAVNWRPLNRLKQPGVMRLWSLQAVARGADAVMFFQWRQSRGGGEKWHSACVPHGPPEKSRVFAEVKQLGRELLALGEVADSRVEAEVALLWDWENAWALNLPEKPRRFDATGMFADWHRALWHLHVSADLAHPAYSLDKYKVVVVPHLYLMSEETALRLQHYVAAGGTLIVGCFSGLVDENERAHLGGYPGLLRDLLGLWIEEFEPLPDDQPNGLRFPDNSFAGLKCGHLCELLHPTTAKTLAVFEKDWFKGRAALTVREHGKGRAYYVATRLEADSLRRWLGPTLKAAGVQPVLEVPFGVEAVQRKRGADRYLFLLNHTAAPVTVKLGQFAGRDLLTGQTAAFSLTLEARGAAVLKLN